MLSRPIVFVVSFLLAHGKDSNLQIVNNCGQSLNVQWSGGSVTIGPNGDANQGFDDRWSGTMWADINGVWSPGPDGHSQAEFTLGGAYGDSYDVSYIKATDNKLRIDVCPVEGTYSGNCPCGSTCAYQAFKRQDNQTARVLCF